MANPYLGMINMFGFNWAPRQHALCNGQMLPISQNTALFSLYGTTYGGDGRTTFGLPSMQGRVPNHYGQGNYGTMYNLGQRGGFETVTLVVSEMPQHTHEVSCNSATADGAQCAGSTFAKVEPASPAFPSANGYGQAIQPNITTMSPLGLPTPAGGGQSHTNMQPYLAICFAAAIEGLFPPRN